jgi:hypothetical protein
MEVEPLLKVTLPNLVDEQLLEDLYEWKNQSSSGHFE